MDAHTELSSCLGELILRADEEWTYGQCFVKKKYIHLINFN